MKLTLKVSIADEKTRDEFFVGEVQIDFPKHISQTLASSVRIASIIHNAADRIKEELEHGGD